MPPTIDFCQFFDIDMDDFAGSFAFIAAWLLRRYEVTLSAEIMLLQSAANGAIGQFQVFCDAQKRASKRCGEDAESAERRPPPASWGSAAACLSDWRGRIFLRHVSVSAICTRCGG